MSHQNTYPGNICKNALETEVKETAERMYAFALLHQCEERGLSFSLISYWQCALGFQENVLTKLLWL